MSKGYIRGANRESLLSNNDRQFSPGQVQNVKSAKVYVFGNDTVVEDEEEYELEMSEIRSRRGQSSVFNPPSSKDTEPVFLERELGEGDTLQKVALQYSCPVAELKRINNLIRDQDFYALRKIKVPIKRYGFLTEIMEEEKRSSRAKASSRINGATAHYHDDGDNPSFDPDPESPHDFSDPDTQKKVIRTLSIRENMHSQSREAEAFLKNMDRDLSKMAKSRTDRNSLDEVIDVLTNKTFHPLHRPKEKLYNGVDCGISYKTVLVCICVICIIVPIIIFVYDFVLKKHLEV